MHACLHPLRLQDVAGDGGRRDTQVGDVHTGGRETRDDRALDHAARVRRRAARDDAVAATQRCSERGGEPDRGLRREVDVDEPDRAVASERRGCRPRLPHDALVDLRARLDLLERIHAHAGEDARLRPDRDLVADRDSFVDADVVAHVAAAADDRTLDHRAAPQVRAGVDHAALDAGPLPHDHPAREHRVRADRRAGCDPAVCADERGADDAVDLLDVDFLAHPHVAAQLQPGHVEPDPAVERVEVRLAELLEVADVLPVAVENMPVDRAPHLEQQGEQLLGEVVRPVGGDVTKHLGLEHVDARVDRVREDLAPRGLLEEAFDLPLLVGHDDPELERVVDRLETDRHRGALLPMGSDERREVDVAECVARDHEEGVVETLLGELHRARGAEGLFLDGVVDVHVERLAAAEVRADGLRHEGERDDDLVHLVPAQQIEDVLHARLADDRHHGLRLVGRQRA